MKIFMWLAIWTTLAVLAAEGSPRGTHPEETALNGATDCTRLVSPLGNLPSHLFQILSELQQLLSMLWSSLKAVLMPGCTGGGAGGDGREDREDDDPAPEPHRGLLSQLLVTGQELLNL